MEINIVEAAVPLRYQDSVRRAERGRWVFRLGVARARAGPCGMGPQTVPARGAQVFRSAYLLLIIINVNVCMFVTES